MGGVYMSNQTAAIVWGFIHAGLGLIAFGLGIYGCADSKLNHLDLNLLDDATVVAKLNVAMYFIVVLIEIYAAIMLLVAGFGRSLEKCYHSFQVMTITLILVLFGLLPSSLGSASSVFFMLVISQVNGGASFGHGIVVASYLFKSFVLWSTWDLLKELKEERQQMPRQTQQHMPSQSQYSSPPPPPHPHMSPYSQNLNKIPYVR